VDNTQNQDNKTRVVKIWNRKEITGVDTLKTSPAGQEWKTLELRGEERNGRRSELRDEDRNGRRSELREVERSGYHSESVQEHTVDPGQKDRKYSGPGRDRILSILRNMTGRIGVGNTQTTRGGRSDQHSKQEK
jgi:hypothetical protein